MTSLVATGLDYRNTNSLWGSVLVETLHRLGLHQAVISPGSRSTPLTVALARHPGIEAIPVLDERSAAFFALGLAKRSQRPVVLLCTSGTAGANYFPAVIESQESGVPLIVITADRPPEMRDCASGQTIDQQKLFGSHVNFYHEFAVPAATLPMLHYLRQTVRQAWEMAQWPAAGPVHLNAPFRDPLPPVEDGTARSLRPVLNEARFFATVKPAARLLCQVERTDFSAVKRGVIVAGPAEGGVSPVDVGLVAGLARDLGWPVLADGLSGLRGESAHFPNLVAHYDAVLRSRKAAARLKPEVVLCLGGWPTSKALRQWLVGTTPEVFMVTGRTGNLDPLHLATRHLRGGLRAFAGGVVSQGEQSAAYTASWRRLEAVAAQSLAQGLAAAKGFEGAVIGNLATNLPEFTPVIVANSMPVRDVEYFWPVNNRSHPIYFNRGANGIDGTLSSALGVAHGHRPAVLLTGDLALLHDTNGFLLGPKFHGSLTIILINNHGGGIFEHLPVAKFNPPFEEYFATPQQVNFRRLASAYGAGHVLVRDAAHLTRLVAKLPKRGIRVLEVRTDRKQDAARRAKLFAAAALAVTNG